MKKFTVTIAMAALGSLSVAALPTPAEAVSDARVSVTKTHVRSGYAGCKTTTVVVTGDWNLDDSNFIDVTVTDPRGVYEAGDFVVDDRDGRVTVPVELCRSYSEPGRYSVEVEVSGYDYDYNETVAYDSTSFRYSIKRPKSSSLSRKVLRQGGRFPWAVGGVLKRNGRAYNNRVVSLQARIQGSWFNIDKSRTRTAGRVAWQFKPNGYLWRFRFDGNASTRADNSPTFQTGHRRVAARTGAVDVATLADLVVR